jgi:hypothetical protein
MPMRLLADGPGWVRFVGPLGLLLVLPVATGCGAGRGKVSGRVLYHGAALPGGSVTFRPADPGQNAVSAVVGEDGHYEAVLPVGEVTVSIDNRRLQPPPNLGVGLTTGLPLPPEMRKDGAGTPPEQPGGAEANPTRPPGHYIKIPDKYYNMETSGLQFTVSGGEQEHDLVLTDD